MKEPDWENCNEQDLWSFVAWHLAKAGIRSVLVGGAVVAIYSEGLYQSNDVDIVADDLKKKEVVSVLAQIGFAETKSRYFKHPECHLVVEFPPGPVSLGDEYQITPDEREVGGQTLLLLSPTDCIKDRLSQYIHWGVRDCFDQAVLVAKTQEERVKLGEVKAWCESEGNSSAFLELVESLKRI